MVVLDSIFIIDHFFTATAGEENENNYTGSKVSEPWLKGHIMLDLILLENQLPFFILDELYKNFPVLTKTRMIPLLTLPANISGNIYFPRRCKTYLRRN